MKKIAFFVQWMACGGVENALISLSKELVNKGHDITIYVIENYGEFMNKIPNNVKIKEIPMPAKIRKCLPVGGTKVSIRRAVNQKEYLKAAYFLFKYIINRTEYAELNINFDKVPLLDEKYDIAVNFHIHSPFLVRYLSEKVNAIRKYCWIHNDFFTTGYNIRNLKMYLECIDKFFCVSQKLKEEFIELMPDYLNNTKVAHNIIHIKEIKNKAKDFYPKEYYKDGILNILTVGRLEEQKGYDLAIKVATSLKNKGIKFQWFVLGNGTLRSNLEHEVRHYNLENCFHFLGIRMNPYPYFKNCDIYVQTSKHEGYVTTVTEAKIFNRPIVTTDVSGAKEQIITGVNGEITGFGINEIAKCVEKLCLDEKIRMQYSEELSKQSLMDVEDWINEFD